MGGSDRFDQAVADFATTHADQVENELSAVMKAIKQGRIAAQSGV